MSTIYELTEAERATMQKLIDMRLVVRRGDVADLLAECIRIASIDWVVFSDTKAAHERNSPEPFRPTDFGFDYGRVMLSRDISDQIRRLKVKP